MVALANLAGDEHAGIGVSERLAAQQGDSFDAMLILRFKDRIDQFRNRKIVAALVGEHFWVAATGAT